MKLLVLAAWRTTALPPTNPRSQRAVPSMKWLTLLLLGCSAAPAPTRAVPLPPRCERALDFVPTRTFRQSDRVVYLEALSAAPAWKSPTARCVDAELEVVEILRGDGEVGQRIRVVAQQEMELDVPRPPGAWWVATEPIVKGGHYTAFCPAGELVRTLPGSCRIASGLRFGTLFAREAEEAQLSFSDTVAKLRASCSAADEQTLEYLVDRSNDRYDASVTKWLVGLMIEQSCASHFRSELRDLLLAHLAIRPPAYAREVIRGLFALLSIPRERWPSHDKLLRELIPNALGLHGNGPKRAAADIFANDPKALAEATAALTSYDGKVDITDLWRWLKTTAPTR